MVMKLGEKCKAKGCKCMKRCWEAWNGLKFWPEKAKACSRANWYPCSDESTGESKGVSS